MQFQPVFYPQLFVDLGPMVFHGFYADVELLRNFFHPAARARRVNISSCRSKKIQPLQVWYGITSNKQPDEKSCMSAKYFLDTNILVYAHDAAYPGKQQRAQNILFEGMRETTGVVSAQVLIEFFVTATKKN